MTKPFTPTSEQRKERKQQKKLHILKKGEGERLGMENNKYNIRYWTPTFFKPKQHTKIDKLIISLPKPLPISEVIRRINDALNPLL